MDVNRRAMLGALAILPGGAIALQATAKEQRQAFAGRYISHHRGRFGGRTIAYSATVAATAVPGATIVTTSYVRTDLDVAGIRPVIFVWGGGPGGSSHAHHGMFMGPKRLPDGKAMDPSARLVNNPAALLDVADLVFVDPPETGFSKIATEADRARLFSVAGDAAAIIAFISRWLKEHKREESPVYLEGSSYGTVRAIRIGWELRKERPLAGLFLTANSAMVQETSRPNGVLGFGADLPTMAMTALHHGKIDRAGRSDKQIIDEAYAFGMGDYVGALARVGELPEPEQKVIAGRLEQFTGIAARHFMDAGLQVGMQDFVRLLLADKTLTLGDYFDGRIAVGPSSPPLPSLKDVPKAFLSYLEEDLGVPGAGHYVGYATAAQQWDFSGPDAASSNDWPAMLIELLEAAPRMHVYSANGYYDLVSTLGQARYLFSRMKLPRGRSTWRAYPGGHGLYADKSTSDSILADLRAIIEGQRPKFP